ncbi:Uncharacterized protein Adt_18665 [Abeliophyllum distichum]|uniref:Uncharacterized protein n=1 Tax=Abeliophyllum distichum TaxID=126358 RepID=A0ABD1TKV2_9LAMI
MDDNNRVSDPPPPNMRNNLALVALLVEVNERDILIGDYMISSNVKNRSSMIYPYFRLNNFQLRLDVINLFLNNLPFYGRTNENPHYHLSRFIEYSGKFKYHGVNEKSLRMRLFPHTLKNKTSE